MLLKKYTSDWADQFLAIESALKNALDGIQFKLEHIGSTAVPKLDAKPIIDVDIVYQEDDDFVAIRKALIVVGYEHYGDQGIEKREVFKRAGRDHEVLDEIKHHLYVCHEDSPPFKSHIAFRDTLRTNADARMEYQELKYQLAEKAGQNQKIYAKLKEETATNFITRLSEFWK